MNSFHQGFLEKQAISQQLLQTVRLIGEYKGKQELFKQRAPQIIKALRQGAIIQSAESSNRIEGITVPLERIEKLVSGKTTPQDRSDREIAGYGEVLNTIYSSHFNIPFTPNVVLEMYQKLYKQDSDIAKGWKTVDNKNSATDVGVNKVASFSSTPPCETPAAMERLHDRFNYFWESGSIEPLLLIPTYILDFLCVRPFLEGNERMARLLTVLLLYKAGYEVGRFISLERIVENTKESHYDTFYLSSQNWQDSQHSLLPWWEYFLGVMLLSAYRELEERVEYVMPAKGTKTAIVLDEISNLPEEFSIKELQEKCPTVSRDLIRHVLRQQRNAGNLVCLGRGVKARWRKR